VGCSVDDRRCGGLGGDALETPGDGEGNLGREANGLADAAVITLRPEERVVGDADELSGDVHVVAGASDGAVDEAIDVERARDLRGRTMGALELHDGRARNDGESGVADEHGDQFVGHAVGKVLLLWISREIFEREHSQ
jgi:hypothetical protein